MYHACDCKGGGDAVHAVVGSIATSTHAVGDAASAGAGTW